jgi:hypothetical protein
MRIKLHNEAANNLLFFTVTRNKNAQKTAVINPEEKKLHERARPI